MVGIFYILLEILFNCAFWITENEQGFDIK